MAKFWIPKKLDKNGVLSSWQGKLIGVFDNVKTISNYGLYEAFGNCIGITGNVSFPKLTSISSHGLNYAFRNCTGITSVSFPALTTVDTFGLYQAFSGCRGITSVSFPALTSIGNNGLSNAFSGCRGITAIHFRADAQSIIEAQSGYSSKFGATNATIYFDL